MALSEPATDPTAWRTATIRGIASVTPRVRSVRLDGVANGYGAHHRAGQHVEIRLRDAQGNAVLRAYSIASAPGDARGLELLIETLDDGAVSAFLDRTARVGDAVELRGPLGSKLAWEPSDGGPVLLIAGGSGVVPLLAMTRARAAARSETPMLLIYSVRAGADLIAREELGARARDEPGFDLTLNVTREGATAGRRIDRVMIETALDHLGSPRHVFVCGGAAFVGTVTDLLRDAHVRPGLIRAERFGR